MSRTMSNQAFQKLLVQRAACKHQQANPYCSFRLLREAELWEGRYDCKELSSICQCCREAQLRQALQQAWQVDEGPLTPLPR